MRVPIATVSVPLVALISLAAWSASAPINHADRLSRIEERLDNLRVWMNRVEDKLDVALGYKSPGAAQPRRSGEDR